MSPNKSVALIVVIAVFLLPLVNAFALYMDGHRGRSLLHVTHMDTETRPNRETRRGISRFMGRSLFVLQGEMGVVTLAQAKLNATDDVDATVIDEFRKESYILDNMPFDDVVNASGRGSTLTYGYTRLVTESGAAFRAINAEYTKSEATKQRVTVDLKVFGGAYDIDRVLAGVAAGAEVSLQQGQKIKAARALFHDAFINGDTAVNANSFDGLDKALTGTTTEFRASEVTDWTGISTESAAHDQIDLLDEFLSLLNGEPTALLGNTKAIAKIRSLARRAGYFTRTENAFGQKVERYGNVALVNMGAKPGTNDPIIPIENRDLTQSRFTITITATGGTYTLTVTNNTTGEDADTTAAIADDADAAAIEAALEALDNVVAADVAVTGTGPFTVTFAGTADWDLTVDDALATGGDVTVAESGAAGVSGLTDIYAVILGIEDLHGIARSDQPVIQQWLPDFTTAGAVKTGEVEMVAATALKRTKSAGVWRNIKV